MSEVQNNSAAPAAESADNSAPNTEVNTNSSDESSDESADSSADQSNAAPQTQAEVKIAKKIKQLMLKIDGKEELSDELPFELEEGSEAAEYMKKQLQLAKVAQKRMSESSDYKKKLDQVGEYLQQAKGNPKKIRELMKDLQIDEKQLAAMIVEEELEKAKKSPAELEKEALQAELQKMKDDRDKEKKETDQREYERLVQHETERYTTMIDSALKSAGLPQSQYVKQKVSAYLLQALDKGMEVTAEDVMPFVQEDVQNEISSMFSAAPEAYIEQLLGKDNLKRLRKRNLEKGKVAPPVPVNTQVQDTGSKSTKSKEEERVSFKNYFKKL